MSWSDTAWNYYSGPSDYSDTLTDDPRNCRVDGCYKKHAYVTLAGRRIYSQYCARHTCSKTLPASEGFHCPTPREEGERYCPDHLKCGEPGCDKMGEYLGLAEYVTWFCMQHRCSAHSCRARATDRQQQRCETHFARCSVPDCPRACHLHRDGRLDIVCAVHYGSFKCAMPGCTRRKPRYDEKYCLAHKCAVSECGAGREAGCSVCITHRCTVPSCTNPAVDPSRTTSVTCREHTCKALRCLAARPPQGDFCRAHACAIPTCRNEARPNPSDSNTTPGYSYCAAKHACAVPTCSRPRLSALPSSRLDVPVPGGDREWCAEHAAQTARTATMTDRERRAASLDFGVDYETLRGRFERGQLKRLSDDLERLRRWERELERERERDREMERERETLERLRREMEELQRRRSGWDPWDDGRF